MQMELVMPQPAKPPSFGHNSLPLNLSYVTQSRSCKQNSHPELFFPTSTSSAFLLSLVELLITQRIRMWHIMYNSQDLSFNVDLLMVSGWKAWPQGVLLDTEANDKEYARTEGLKYWKCCPKVETYKSVRSHFVISKLHRNMQYLTCAQSSTAYQEKQKTKHYTSRVVWAHVVYHVSTELHFSGHPAVHNHGWRGLQYPNSFPFSFPWVLIIHTRTQSHLTYTKDYLRTIHTHGDTNLSQG